MGIKIKFTPKAWEASQQMAKLENKENTKLECYTTKCGAYW